MMDEFLLSGCLKSLLPHTLIHLLTRYYDVIYKQNDYVSYQVNQIQLILA